MIDSALLSAIEASARDVLGSAFHAERVESVRGGDISAAFRIGGAGGELFVKVGGAEQADAFEAELAGLRALAECEAIRVPQSFGVVTTIAHSALLMEWLEIQPLTDAENASRAGAALAQLHRLHGPRYGWTRDNYIGRTPQANPQSENWSRFFVHNRLIPQFERAAAKGYKGDLQRQGERICDKAPALFLEYRAAPSLLHGDLWHGNIGMQADGTPVLFDPACYWGDREADLAMTELFGGFPLAFYAAYRREWPLDADYERRKPLYNLYHVLNHLNLFGRGYLAQAERMAVRLAAELSL